MRLRLLLTATAAALLILPAAAHGAGYVPGEVLVKYRDGTTRTAASSVEQVTGTDTTGAIPGGTDKLAIEDGDSVRQTVKELEQDPSVAYAVPNYVARASGLVPNDPAFRLQWNLAGPFGIGMPDAWTYARQRHAPGARGAVVAVLDTGVAYRRYRRFRRAPDLHNFAGGYDFVDNDRLPLDLNGHGTHVASTIAESTGNKKAAAGIAYRAKIMPLRVLDSEGTGDTVAIARAIRFAAKRKVDVINLSLEFGAGVRASEIPDVISAIRYAHKRGSVVVAAAGNQAEPAVAYPAKSRTVIAVAATTDRGCQADYSNSGGDVDIAAPGGGVDAPNADNPMDAANCRPDEPGRSIIQQTFTSSVRRFGLPRGYEGTSMAAPHVSGVVAMVMASRRLGSRRPSPAAIERHLHVTARDLGPPGRDDRYGYGLLDAARAMAP